MIQQKDLIEFMLDNNIVVPIQKKREALVNFINEKFEKYKEEPKFIFAVFMFVNISSNDQEYDVLKGVFDSEEKAILRKNELNLSNKKSTIYYDIDKIEVK